MARTTNLGDTPFHLLGEELRPGDRAPDFRLQRMDWSDCTLASFAGRTLVLCSVLSLDTDVCDAEMRRFNARAADLADTTVVAVSMDLPPTLGRWCGAQGIAHVVPASDHRDASFGRAYGCLVTGGSMERFLSRAVFVVDPSGVVRYVEYVPEVGQEPDYERALAAARG